MTSARVLVTTAWIRPGDPLSSLLVDAGCEVVHSSFTDRATTGEQLIDLVAGADAIVAGTDPFSAEVIAAAPELKVIGRTGIGYNNIDVAAATAHGIAVCPTPGVNRQSVAELTIGLMLDCARRISQNVAAVRAGQWDQSSGVELDGTTLGILGLGAIGKRVAELAQAFGMSVIAYDPYFDEAYAAAHGISQGTFEQVLRESDFVSLHLFLDDSTYHLFDAEAFALMKPTAFVINAARGGIIDEDALADAVESGQIAGAALDVVEEEPLPLDSRLAALDRIVVTAHVGAATAQSRLRSGGMAVRSVLAVLRGEEPEFVLNPEHAADVAVAV